MSNLNLTEKEFIKIVFNLERDIALQKEMIDLLRSNYSKALRSNKPISHPMEDKYEISKEAVLELDDMIKNLIHTEDKNNKLWFKDPLEYSSIVALYQDKRNKVISYKVDVEQENENIHEYNQSIVKQNRQSIMFHTENMRLLWKQLREVQNTLKETQEVVNNYYQKTDFLPNEKYHNLVTLSMINEYFNDHRANTIGEALNIYNSEQQHKNIESKLDNISVRVDNLEEQLVGIKQNQHILYEAIQENKEVMFEISNDVNSQMSEIEHLNNKLLDVNSGVQNVEYNIGKLEKEILNSSKVMVECQSISQRNHEYTHKLLGGIE